MTYENTIRRSRQKTAHNYREASRFMADLTDFHHTTMAAITVTPGEWVPEGKLPDYFANALRTIVDHSVSTYIVYSYKTPIAWVAVDADGTMTTTVPDVRYSVTTSKHQGKTYVLPGRRTI